MLIDDLRKHGFRRWYERQLIESHAYLVLAFLALIVLGAGMEWATQPHGWTTWIVIGVVAAGAALVAFVGWRRFIVVLARAELFAQGATCSRCQTWGRFAVIAAEAESDDVPLEAGRPHWVRVKCAKCGFDWRLG